MENKEELIKNGYGSAIPQPELKGVQVAERKPVEKLNGNIPGTMTELLKNYKAGDLHYLQEVIDSGGNVLDAVQKLKLREAKEKDLKKVRNGMLIASVGDSLSMLGKAAAAGAGVHIPKATDDNEPTVLGKRVKELSDLYSKKMKEYKAYNTSLKELNNAAYGSQPSEAQSQSSQFATPPVNGVINNEVQN